MPRYKLASFVVLLSLLSWGGPAPARYYLPPETPAPRLDTPFPCPPAQVLLHLYPLFPTPHPWRPPVQYLPYIFLPDPAPQPWRPPVSEPAKPDAAKASIGPFADEIQKVLSLGVFDGDSFRDSTPISAGRFERALLRTCDLIPLGARPRRPDRLVENIVARPLTRLDVIRMAVHCLVADSRLETFAAGSDGTVVDPDVNVVFYSSPHDYLSRYSDAGALDDGDLLAVGTAAYKGWIPNQDSDGGRLKPDAPASMAFAACVLARALARFTLDSTEYTGILIDMRRLDFIPRASAMWILSGGDPECGCGDIRKIYPDAAHPQSGPFYTAPGVLGYYGTCEEAMAGRAGSHPLVICALDWAQCDWSGNQSEPALRRGGGNGAPITHFSFTRGTPPLILISSEDASRLQQFDRRTLLARMGRVAMVHPGW